MSSHDIAEPSSEGKESSTRLEDSPAHSEQAVLAGLSALSRQMLDGDTSATDHRELRTRLLLKARSKPNGRWWPWVPATIGSRLSVVGALATLLVVLIMWARPAKKPLNYIVGGGADPSGVVRAVDHEVHVRFDDGTNIAFEPGAAGRIADVTPNGARIILGAGRAHFDVVHREEAKWTIEAGSYLVRVTGTEFDIDWSPTLETLHVVMQRGSVAVEGAKSEVPALVAGNALDIEQGGGVTIHTDSVLSVTSFPSASSRAAAVIEPSLPEPTLPPAVSGTILSLDAIPASSSSPALSVSAAPSSGLGSASWSKRVESGDYAAIVAEASARGIDSVVKSVGLDDLVALNDAARYSGHSDIAAKVLGGIRSRFPDSQASHTAAFLLGRMADDRGAFKEAIALYNEYLMVGGPFSGEALGRKMIALDRSGDSASAKLLAADYLQKHPDGSYAAFARGLVSP